MPDWVTPALPDLDKLPDPATLTHRQALALALWSFDRFLNAIVTESQRSQGRPENPEAVRVYGDMIERAAARARAARAEVDPRPPRQKGAPGGHGQTGRPVPGAGRSSVR